MAAAQEYWAPQLGAYDASGLTSAALSTPMPPDAYMQGHVGMEGLSDARFSSAGTESSTMQYDSSSTVSASLAFEQQQQQTQLMMQQLQIQAQSGLVAPQMSQISAGSMAQLAQSQAILASNSAAAGAGTGISGLINPMMAAGNGSLDISSLLALKQPMMRKWPFWRPKTEEEMKMKKDKRYIAHLSRVSH